MRTLLGLAAIFAFLPNAFADGGNDKQFTHQEEFRVRYVFEDNQSGNSGMAPNNGNTVEQRLKLAGQYKVSERFSVAATLMNAMTWGSPDLYVYDTSGHPGPFSAGDAAAVHNGTSANNFLMIQEAYGTWMMSDDFMVRFGRGSFTMADGSVIAVNDYEPVPYSFDGILGTYDFGLARVSAWAIKFSQYSNAYMAQAFPGATYSGSGQSDPEADGYGLSFDLQKMPEWLKMVNAHVMLNTKAATPGAFTSYAASADPMATMGQNIIRYGIAIGGAASIFDYKFDAAGLSGTYNCEGAFLTGCQATNILGAQNTAMTSMSASAYMAQGEFGVNFHDFMKARIFGRAHWDSGDQDNVNNATKIGTYDGYFYDKYAGGGEMEVLNWGNLTFYNAGVSVMPTDQMSVRLQYFYYLKSSTEGRMNPGRYGDMMSFTSQNDNALGQEIDLSAEQKYDGGFSILAHAGMFIPGSSVKSGLTDDPYAQILAQNHVITNTSDRSDIYTQVMVQGKMNF